MKLKDFDYRIWDNETKQYIKKDKTIYDGRLGFGYIYNTTITNYSVEMPKHLCEEECEIELWTELKDSNGNKIYEGDIVEIRNDDENYKNKAEVVFELGEFLFYVVEGKNNKITGEHFNVFMTYNDTLKVVGNIHSKE